MRVLIADDSTEISERLGERLAEIPGVDIVCFAADGDATMDAIRRHRPDVVTLDLRMPGCNGLTVLERLRGEGLAPFVIVLTSYNFPEYRRRAERLGAAVFLDKSREFDRVAEIVRERMRANGASPSEEASVGTEPRDLS